MADVEQDRAGMTDWVQRAEREVNTARAVLVTFAEAEDKAQQALHDAQQQVADRHAALRSAQQNLALARMELAGAHEQLGCAVARAGSVKV